jgi:hypothetical protein
VYAAQAFEGPTQITSLTFFYAEQFGGPTTMLPGNYQISLSTTTRAVDGLSTDLSSNIGQNDTVIFSGNLGGVNTSPSVTISMARPFTYDPRQGNLLLNVVATNQANQPNVLGAVGYLSADTTGTVMTRAFIRADLATGVVESIALVTKFN